MGKDVIEGAACEPLLEKVYEDARGSEYYASRS